MTSGLMRACQHQKPDHSHVTSLDRQSVVLYRQMHDKCTLPKASHCVWTVSLSYVYLWGAATNGTGGFDTLPDLHRCDGLAAFLAARAPGW